MTLQQAKTNHIDKFAPINVVLLHETIKHVLLAGEQLGKSRMVILEEILDHKEREDKQQFQYLKTTQLAIMVFFDTDARRTEIEVTDCSHNAVYCLVAIVFMEESIDF